MNTNIDGILQDDDKFCEAFGLPLLFAWQRQVKASEAERVIVEKGRQIGWSVFLNIMSLMVAVRNANFTVVRVSASDRQVSADAEELMRSIPKSMTTRLAPDRILFKNGSTLYCVPPNPQTIRGFRPRFSRGKLHGIVLMVDEASHIPEGERVLRALEYGLLAAPEGKRQIFIGSTPTTASSWFHQMYVEGKENPSRRIQSFHFPSSANPNIKPEDIEYLRQTKPSFEFANEVLGEVLTSETTYFADVLEHSLAKYKLGLAEPEGVKVLGIDLAKIHGSRGKDRHGLIEWTRHSKTRLTWTRLFRNSSVQEIAAMIFQRNSEIGGFRRIMLESYDSSGLFEILSREGLPVELVNPTPQNKITAFSYWHSLMATGNCEISEEALDLLDEMRAFEYRVSATGAVGFGHPEGSTKIHDDLVHAGAWALLGLKGVGYDFGEDSVFSGGILQAVRLETEVSRGLSVDEVVSYSQSLQQDESDNLSAEMREHEFL
ncbi:MAG: hypothetical protein HZB10_00400 [Candidatus Yonathbacteria bacterium]|nr:hypothetical protein [Candidatus Yonathbacteria bacterium]